MGFGARDNEYERCVAFTATYLYHHGLQRYCDPRSAHMTRERTTSPLLRDRNVRVCFVPEVFHPPGVFGRSNFKVLVGILAACGICRLYDGQLHRGHDDQRMTGLRGVGISSRPLSPGEEHSQMT